MKLKSILFALTAALAASASVQSFASTEMGDAAKTVVAREASEGPRGNDNERPGDRQRRGGKAWDDSHTQTAREASEGPRGNDNERPGDRQRRGGRG